MNDLRRKYLQSMIFGLVLTGVGLFCWRAFGLLMVPAVPSVRVPLSPFMCVAGIVLTVISALLWREAGDSGDKDGDREGHGNRD